MIAAAAASQAAFFALRAIFLCSKLAASLRRSALASSAWVLRSIHPRPLSSFVQVGVELVGEINANLGAVLIRAIMHYLTD
jgi:hypothetical protein